MRASRSLLAVVAVSSALAGCGGGEPVVSPAPVAAPDAGERRYLVSVRGAGVRGSDEQLLGAARAVCAAGAFTTGSPASLQPELVAVDLVVYGYVESVHAGRAVTRLAGPACAQ